MVILIVGATFSIPCMEHDGLALNVITDNGSGMNIISSDVVEHLGLIVEKHPTPYRVSWVNEENPILVKHHCLVKFALGDSYLDEAWCDVDPITICHLLLGRPWIYDRKVRNDNYANSYSFTFNGKKFLLTLYKFLSLKHIQNKTKQKYVDPVLTIRQFTQVLKGEQLVLLVVNHEAKQDDGIIPNEIMKMLEEFQDIMPDEMPKQLPPLQEVQHAIDLI